MSSFAATEVVGQNVKNLIDSKAIGKVIMETEKKNSCTVHVIAPDRDVTITITCDCSQMTACQQAFHIATIGM